MYQLFRISFIAYILTLYACKQSVEEKKFSPDEDSLISVEEAIKEIKNIFYRVYLPSEMYKIFDKVGAFYDPSILNPAENVNLYESSTKAALNIGVYGVDLGYNRIFGQNQKTLLYFTVIHKLSRQLGIPEQIFTQAVKRMEQNIVNRDSMVKYATELYVATSEYLRENDRGVTAALILTGGWVEAMYVASKIADEVGDNREIIERIAFQKYSLRSLLAILANYKSNIEINRIYLMLKALNQVYDKFEIYYSPDDISIDTINKYIRAKKIEFYLPPENLKEIKKMIIQIRTEIVS